MDWQVKYAKDMLIEHVDRDKRRYGNIKVEQYNLLFILENYQGKTHFKLRGKRQRLEFHLSKNSYNYVLV